MASLVPASLRGFLQLALQVVLAAALVVALEFAASRRNHRFDFTPTQAFVLSPFAVQVTEAFPDDAEIVAFYNAESGDRQRMFDLLQQFSDANGRIHFRLADLDHSPALAKKYGVTSYNTGVLESGGQRLELRAISEEEVVSTLLRLSRATPHSICFVTAHGEHDPESADPRFGLSELAKNLETQRFATASLATVANGVPERCSILAFAGPSHDLVAGEADAVWHYAAAGGQVLLLIDPDTPASFVDLLARFGIKVGNNVIVDEANRMVGADSFVVQVVRFRPDVFEDRLRAAAILPIVRTVRAAEQRPDGSRVVSIAGTSPDSWACEGSTEIPDQDIRFDRDKDEPGPLSVGVLTTLKRADPENPRRGRVMVFGDSDFATNQYFTTLGNADLVTAAVAVLAQEPLLIATGKTEDKQGPPLVLTDKQTRTIFWTAFLVLPGLSLLFGLVVLRWRQRRSGGR